MSASSTSLPEDPRVRAAVLAHRAAAKAGSFAASRRQFVTGALGVAGAGALLAACGTGGSTGSKTAAVDTSETDKKVRWANWTLYLDQDESGTGYPTLEAFEKKTGISADYSEDIEDNDSFYGKVSGQLANGQDIGYDIVTLTDWMAGRMIRQKYVQPLDLTKIPNAANLRAALKDVDYDPGRKYTLTWQSGMAGLAWDKSKIPGGMTGMADLWAPELAGRVEVLSEMHDTIGLIMLDQGVDPAGDWGDDEFNNALDFLKGKISSGHIRQVRGNSYTQDLINGDALAVIGWSGDIMALNLEQDDKFGFAIPEAGGTLFSDELMIPVGSPHKANAEALMNYYYDPEVAAQVAAWVQYITPVEGAKEAMEKVDPSLVDSELIFPGDDTMSRLSIFRTLTPEEETKYNGAFLDAIGA